MTTSPKENSMTFKGFLSEDTNPSVIKMINKAVKWLKREHPQAFKGDYVASTSFISATKAEITVKINHFLADCPQDKQEYDFLARDVTDAGMKIAEALKAEDNGVFAGPIANSLIKPGAKIDADVLLSYVSVTFTFPTNFKR